MHLSLNLLGVVFSSSRRTKVLSGLIPDIRFLIYPIYITGNPIYITGNPIYIHWQPYIHHRQPYIHSRALPPSTYIQELMTRSQQRPSWLSWQSVALDSRGREFDSHRRPRSCIFRNWSWLSLRKIYAALAKYPDYLPLLVIECKMQYYS